MTRGSLIATPGLCRIYTTLVYQPWSINLGYQPW